MPFPIRVADVMSSPVETAGPETPAHEAAATCSAADIGSLVVANGGEIVGIVTSADFLDLLGSDADPRDRPVSEFMSAPVVTVESDVPIRDAVATMTEAGVTRLPVVADGALAGILTSDDVVHHVPQVFHRHQFDPATVEDHRFRARQETAYEREDWSFECMCRTDDAVSVGDRVTFSKTLSQQDVRSFAAASGDTNRLHLEEEFAQQTRFGRRIVHGTLVGGLISAALARLPGLTIYLSQDLSFLTPVDIGDRATAICEVMEALDGGKYQLRTDVLGPDDEQVIEGEAAVLVDQPPTPDQVEFEPVA